MVIKYKNYVGTVIAMNQIKRSVFKFTIQDKEDSILTFTTDINEIRIVNCIGNETILSDVKESILNTSQTNKN